MTFALRPTGSRDGVFTCNHSFSRSKNDNIQVSCDAFPRASSSQRLPRGFSNGFHREMGKRRSNPLRFKVSAVFNNASLEQVAQSLSAASSSIGILPSAIKLDGDLLMASISSSFKLFSLCCKYTGLPSSRFYQIQQLYFKKLLS